MASRNGKRGVRVGRGLDSLWPSGGVSGGTPVTQGPAICWAESLPAPSPTLTWHHTPARPWLWLSPLPGGHPPTAPCSPHRGPASASPPLRHRSLPTPGGSDSSLVPPQHPDRLPARGRCWHSNSAADGASVSSSVKWGVLCRALHSDYAPRHLQGATSCTLPAATQGPCLHPSSSLLRSL